MKKILIITHNQFGYQTDYYNYSKYLSYFFKVDYYCFDQSKPRIIAPEIEVNYKVYNVNNLLKLIYFNRDIKNYLKKHNYDLVLLKYFPGCSILSKKITTPLVVDVRTGSVSSNFLNNYLQNIVLKLELNRIKYVTIISENLANFLKISNDYHILPLGGNLIETKNNFNKIKDEFNLIYIGTLKNRNIHFTVDGISEFLNKNHGINLKYYIIGDGNNNDIEILTNKIKYNKLDNVVYYLGYIENDKLTEYLSKADIGISYIPLKKHYQNQPPTKTYEYLLSGIPVIATKTKENTKIINANNGILIQDNAHSFLNGLEKIIKNFNNFDKVRIQESVIVHTWKNIVNKNLYPYLIKIISNDQKPRIALIGVKGFPAIGGAARSNELLVQHLEKDFDITVYEIDSHKSNLTSGYPYTSVVFKGSKLRRLNTLIYYTKSCFHALIYSKYDLIHTQHLYSGFIVPFLRIRYKVINTIHGIIPSDDDKWNLIDKLFFRFFERISLNFSNLSISVSKPQINYLKSLTKKEILYIPNGVGIVQSLVEKRKETIKKEIIFSAARIIRLKGCHTFLQALDSINYKGNIKIIGSLDHVPVYKKEILALSKNLNVSFLGLISDKNNLFEELLTAKYFVFPSTKEGLSNMLLEVASLNIPIICSDIEENKAVFSQDEVLFFKTEDHEDLAEKILFADNNQMEMEQKAIRALERLKTDYRWDNIANKYKDIYNRLIQS